MQLVNEPTLFYSELERNMDQVTISGLHMKPPHTLRATSKTCLKQPLKRRPKFGFQDMIIAICG